MLRGTAYIGLVHRAQTAAIRAGKEGMRYSLAISVTCNHTASKYLKQFIALKLGHNLATFLVIITFSL